MNPAPKVSVCMTTYNHERYLAKAIESVMLQETRFAVELIIGEDCSTDATGRIAAEFAQRYPDRIVLLAREKNMGMMENFCDVYDRCRGTYTAFLEGDDLWSDTTKLQQQVDALEQRPDWVLCFHPARYIDSEGRPLGMQHPAQSNPELTLSDMVMDNPISTCSILLRRSVIPRVPDNLKSLNLGDWPLCIVAAREGKIGFLSEPMAAYRVHGGGVWTSASRRHTELSVLNMLLQLALDYPDLAPLVRESLANRLECFFTDLEAAQSQVKALQNASWRLRLKNLALWPLRKANRMLFKRPVAIRSPRRR
ncbi:glycosyltransferase [Lignipirellula cremea]|uniref:Glycosyltransferase EpsE n=1 Tax=Lignipirellula cremea TaxID=2528010 RepID=A0A518DL35_9BACT|nr:glycosyltransferase [Lignipirellula cremea]QDU92545.1 Putative glycosyltransferase EpsE [Lignipirellula cremea]